MYNNIIKYKNSEGPRAKTKIFIWRFVPMKNFNQLDMNLQNIKM